jgi:hypothetical protein
LEPLQDKDEKLVMDIDTTKNKSGTDRLGGRRYIKSSSHHTDGRSYGKKRNQAQEKCQQITQMYEALAQAVKDAGVSE